MDVGFDVWVLDVEPGWITEFASATPTERWNKLMEHDRNHPGAVSFSEAMRHMSEKATLEECKACGDKTLRIEVTDNTEGNWTTEAVCMKCPCGYTYESSSRYYRKTNVPIPISEE